MLSFYNYDIKNRLKICQAYRGSNTQKQRRKQFVKPNIKGLIFLFLPKKSYLQKSSFIMANLRATSRRTNFKKYREQIFVKNIQSQKEKTKC